MSVESYKGIKLKDGLEVKSNTLIPRENIEAEFDYMAMLWTGGLLEDLVYLIHTKKNRSFNRIFVCLRAYNYIEKLQKEKRFKIEDMQEMFHSMELEDKDVIKTLDEIYKIHKEST